MALGPLELVPGLAVGTGVGGGISTVIEPLLRQLANDTWSREQSQPLDPLIAAQAFVQGLSSQGADAGEAALNGVSGGRFATLAEVLRTAPGTGELLELLRRRFIDPVTFEEALRKNLLQDKWFGPLAELEQVLLSPADLAMARQQGFVDQGRAESESQLQGVDAERADILFEMSGLPPGIGEALELYRRGEIDAGLWAQIVREGHTKTKYTDLLLKLAVTLLSPAEAANLVIRQWISESEGAAIAAKWGLSSSDFSLMVSGTGRPPGPGQLQTALNRKLIDSARFGKGIAESDVRPEWTSLLEELRVRYPTAFVLRQLTQTKAITPAEAAQILEFEGWPADLASKSATAWAAGATAKAKQLAQGVVDSLYEARYIDAGEATALLTKLGYDSSEIGLLLELGDARRVKRFLDAAVSRVHSLYTRYRISESQASSSLDTLGISSQARDDILAEWRLEREVNEPALTPAQLAAGAYYGIISRDEALTELQRLGYSDLNSRILVDIRAHGTPAPGVP